MSNYGKPKRVMKCTRSGRPVHQLTLFRLRRPYPHIILGDQIPPLYNQLQASKMEQWQAQNTSNKNRHIQQIFLPRAIRTLTSSFDRSDN
ncbi:hypothetical protein BaRGS_00016356 [Batillaria attramentaria]|uniref:Uncharacterized protein n=1 Tax=Batillaria attramentaria TaxID=370345 RepID=A0ABD0KZE6_9CAEN